MNCFAYAGHGASASSVGTGSGAPRMQQLARRPTSIEAYILPGGVSSQLFREIGGGRSRG
jgi:propionate CoA-transferase